MKKLFQEAFSTIKVADMVRAGVCTAVNAVILCESITIVYLLIALMYMSRFSVIAMLLVVAWMIVCTLLFRSLKVWLVFLPAQYLLCTIILYFTHYTGISVGGEMSFGECALAVLVSVVIQFLGVGTRSLYRKLRNSIQASFAA